MTHTLFGSLSLLADVSPRLIIRVVEYGVLIVGFAFMNVLYKLFWKNNAVNDYFESRGITPPPDDENE